MNTGGAAWLARVPWAVHFLAATICVVATGVGVWKFHAGLAQHLHAQRLEQRALEQKQAELQSLPGPEPVQSFHQTLPLNRGSDELVQFLSAQAKALNVQVSALSIQRTSASSVELGRVQFQLSLRGTYAAVKSLLGDLLGRYPSLGIQSLNLRPKAQDAMQTEAEALLVWYVKD